MLPAVFVMEAGMNTEEQWKNIYFAPGYEVSDKGRVRSWRPLRRFAKAPDEPRILSFVIDKDGYKKVVLYIDGKAKTSRVCALVSEAWHGKRADGMVVRHKDGSKDNDTPGNLIWGTIKENSEDSKIHGTYVHGTKVNTCKLTEEQVCEIRNSNESCRKLAEIYPVNSSMIGKIKNRTNWKHI